LAGSFVAADDREDLDGPPTTIPPQALGSVAGHGAFRREPLLTALDGAQLRRRRRRRPGWWLWLRPP